MNFLISSERRSAVTDKSKSNAQILSIFSKKIFNPKRICVKKRRRRRKRISDVITFFLIFFFSKPLLYAQSIANMKKKKAV